MKLRPRALLVGDEMGLLKSWGMVLGTRFDVRVSPRLSEALSLVVEQTFDLIVVLPDIDNWKEFGEMISRQSPKNIIAVTKTGDRGPSWANVVVPLLKGSFGLLEVCAEKFGINMKSTKSHGFSDRQWKRVNV